MTALERLLAKSKELREGCQPCQPGQRCDWEPCIKLRNHIHATSDLKDQMISIMAEALEQIHMRPCNLKIDCLCCLCREILTQVEALALKALGDGDNG